MASQVAALAAAIPGQAADIMADLAPLMALGLGLAFAGGVVLFIRSII